MGVKDLRESLTWVLQWSGMMYDADTGEPVEHEEPEPDFSDLMPEGAMPVTWFRCVQYITKEGEQLDNMDWSEDVPRSSILGLLEISKLKFYAFQQECDEADESG